MPTDERVLAARARVVRIRQALAFARTEDTRTYWRIRLEAALAALEEAEAAA